MTYVLISDGECNEGSVWEAALFAAHFNLNNLICVIDYNKIQRIKKVSQTIKLEPFVKKWQSFVLSDSNRLQVLVPPKFGNGHLVLSDKAIFHYKQNSNYDRDGQFTIAWNDPEYGFCWPIANPITSIRDKAI